MENTRDVNKIMDLDKYLLPITVLFAILLFLNPVFSKGLPSCPNGDKMLFVETKGMGWYSQGFSYAELPKLERAKIIEYVTRWAKAYALLGIDRVLLPDIAKEISSWGAVEKVPGKTFGRYDFFALDAIVESFNGVAVIPVTSECWWDQHDGLIPMNMNAFLDYIRAVAERYDGDIDFGVPVQDESYPDIDGSGKVTISDWEATEEEKKGWAENHKIAGIMIGTEFAPQGVPKAEYAELVLKIRDVIRKANPKIEIWIAPFSAAMGKADISARFSPFAGKHGEERPFDFATVECPEITKDLTVQKGVSQFEMVNKWLKESGVKANEEGGVTLIPLVRFYDREAQTFCPSVQCSKETQSEQMIKAIGMFAAKGTKGIAYQGVLGKDESQGDALAVFSVALQSSAILNIKPAGLIFDAVCKIFSTNNPGKELVIGVSNAYAIKGKVCGDLSFILCWYDWTRDVDPNSQYSGLVKIISFKQEGGGVSKGFALYTDPQTVKVGEDKISINPDEVKLEDKGDGVISVSLGRSPVLVVSGISETPIADISPEVEPQTSEELVKKPSSGGCTGGVSVGFVPYAILILLMCLMHKRHAT